MGRVIAKKIRGMNLWVKVVLTTTFTLLLCTFMYQGWYKPKSARAAVVTYYARADTTTNVGADGICNLPTGTPAGAQAAPTYTTMQTTELGTAARYYAPIVTNAVVLKIYGPVYTANAVDISNISVSWAARGSTAGDTITLRLYDYDPAGAAGNKTLVATTAVSKSLTTTLAQYTWAAADFTISGTGRVQQNHRLLLEVVGNSTATASRMMYCGVTGATSSSNITVTETAVTASNLAVTDSTNPANANAMQGSVGNGMNGFNMAVSAGTGPVNTLTLTGSAQFTSANVAAIKIYHDLGTIGTFDAADTIIATTTAWAGNVATITFTTPEALTTTATPYLVVVDLQNTATVGNTLSGTITGATGTVGTPTFADTTSGTLTVTAGAALTVGNSTNPVNANAMQGSVGNGMDGFTMSVSAGTGSVNTLTLTGSAQFTSANVAAIKIYHDLGTIGTFDAADTIIATTTAWAANVATITFTTPEALTTTVTPYLVVVDLQNTATVGNTLSGTVTAATGSGYVSSTYSDTASGTLTVTAGAALTVGNSTNPVNANAMQGSVGNGMDGFTMSVSAGSGSVNTLTLTGSAQFTSANVAAIKIYHDLGTIGTFDVADTLIATTTAWAANVATITFTTAEAINTTVTPYLVVVDVQPTATVGNTLSGTITAATGSGYVSSTYNDTASGTLTITTPPNLTVGNGTDPVNASPMQSTANNAIDSFTMAVSSGSGTVSSLTLTTSAQFTVANVANIRVYRDAGTLGVYDSALDTLVPSTYSIGAGTATITFTTSENVTTTAANYLITVDIAAAATVGNTLTARVTGATGTVGTPTYSDTASATLTIALNAKLPWTITSCSGCHGSVGSFTDGTARNTPANTFIGSHNEHVVNYGYACAKCHVVPGPTNYAHRNELIEMAVPINGNTGGVYLKGSSFTQANPPTAFTGCTNIYCHSQGTSMTSNAGETRTTIMSTSALSPLIWGTTGTCGSCHGNPPSYANGATTWGAAKANSHVAHDAFKCNVCHNETTSDGTTITDRSKHINRFYNISSLGGGGQAWFSYTYTATYVAGTGSSTCNNIYCHNLNNISQTAKWGGVITLGCVDCHSKTIYRSAGRTGTILANVVAEFGLAWGHKKTGRGAVTDGDCIVCHLEGMYTGSVVGATIIRSAKHADGNIDLRDPDGAGETPITNISGAAWTFQRFSTSYAATSRYPDGHTRNNIDNIITIKFCMKCHDSNGATNPTARNGTAGTAAMPFGGIALGAAYTSTNGAIGTQGLINVFTQFSSGNSSRHPVGAPNNRAYPYSTRLVAPYNGFGTARNGNTIVNPAAASPRVKANSVVMYCNDCHTDNTTRTRRTITAHGNAVTLRGTFWTAGAQVNTPTLCMGCHGGTTANNATTSYYDGSGGDHNDGSGLSVGDANINGIIQVCSNCHFSAYNDPGRPIRAFDAHGFNGLLATGGAWTYGASNGMRPVAFMRNVTQWTAGIATSPRPYQATVAGPGNFNLAAGTPSCSTAGVAFGANAACTSNTHSPYAPGGSY